MNPRQIIHALKVVAFIGTFYAAVVWLLQPAKGGVISLTLWEEQQAHLIDLSSGGYEDWAVWGTGASNSLNATYAKYSGGRHPINYTLIDLSNGDPLAGIGALEVSNAFQVAPFTNLFAGIAHDGFGQDNDPVGSGFIARIKPLASGSSRIDVYFGTHDGSAQVVASGGGYPVQSLVTPNEAGDHLWLARLWVTGTSLLTVGVTLNEEYDPNLNSGVFVSAVSIIPAPEPSNLVLAGIGLVTLLVASRFTRKKK